MQKDDDFRRITSMPLAKALKNPHTASDWLAEKMNLEPHQVHISKTSEDEMETNLEGSLLIQGVSSFNFKVKIKK
jgi:hypothetical protein